VAWVRQSLILHLLVLRGQRDVRGCAQLKPPHRGQPIPHVRSHVWSNAVSSGWPNWSTWSEACFAPPVGIEPTTDRLETDHDQQ
jgi:hypothetical protein